MDFRPMLVLGLVGGAGYLVWREVQASAAAKAEPVLRASPVPVHVPSPVTAVVDLVAPAAPSRITVPGGADFYRGQLPAARPATPQNSTPTTKRAGIFTRLVAAA